MAQSDPVAFAENFLHYSNLIDNGRERYLDGNGRTWRLMTDLALLKLGRAPIIYPSLADYATATNRKNSAVLEEKLTREDSLQQFRNWAAAGQAALDAVPAAKVP
jgi:Fic family protein